MHPKWCIGTSIRRERWGEWRRWHQLQLITRNMHPNASCNLLQFPRVSVSPISKVTRHFSPTTNSSVHIPCHDGNFPLVGGLSPQTDSRWGPRKKGRRTQLSNSGKALLDAATAGLERWGRDVWEKHLDSPTPTIVLQDASFRREQRGERVASARLRDKAGSVTGHSRELEALGWRSAVLGKGNLEAFYRRHYISPEG